MPRIFIALMLTWFATSSTGAEPGFYVLKYTPGDSWKTAVDFYDQTGVSDHRAYLRKLYDENILLMAGVLVDEPGELVILRVESPEQARDIAMADPAVTARTLAVEVSGWKLELSAMRNFRRAVPDENEPQRRFRVERLDPSSPINIKELPSP